MDQLLNVLVIGLLLGGVYGLVSVGLNLIFGTVRIVNFAQGDVMMLGAFVAFTFASLWQLPFALAVLMALLSYLMVSNLEYPSFKAVNWRTKRSFHWVLVSIFAVVFTVLHWQWMPSVIFVSYLLYGLVRPWVSRKWRREIEIEPELPDNENVNEDAALSGSEYDAPVVPERTVRDA
jgi:branched-subunit amino acid ABC-type transport system permease component